MGIINEIINDFQKEKLNAQYLKDYDYDFTDGKWNWPMLNAKIDLFQGVTSWARDLAIGFVWLINPFHWDDAIEGGIYSVTHISEVVPAIMDEVKTTYEEQGLVYCVGYVIPEVLAYFYGAGEAKAVSNLEKVDDITKLGKHADDVANFNRSFDTFEHNSATKIQKGNYAEWTTNHEIASENVDIFNEKGYDLDALEGFDNAPSDLNATGAHGIDHVFTNANPPPDYVIVESKYNTSQLNPKTADGRQMSDKWVDARMEKLGIEGTYDKYISRVDIDGNVTIKQLNEAGYIMKGN